MARRLLQGGLRRRRGRALTCITEHECLSHRTVVGVEGQAGQAAVPGGCGWWRWAGTVRSLRMGQPHSSGPTDLGAVRWTAPGPCRRCSRWAGAWRGSSPVLRGFGGRHRGPALPVDGGADAAGEVLVDVVGEVTRRRGSRAGSAVGMTASTAVRLQSGAAGTAGPGRRIRPRRGEVLGHGGQSEVPATALVGTVGRQMGEYPGHLAEPTGRARECDEHARTGVAAEGARSCRVRGMCMPSAGSQVPANPPSRTAR